MTPLQVFYGSMVLNGVAGLSLVLAIFKGNEFLMMTGLATAVFGLGFGGFAARSLAQEGST